MLILEASGEDDKQVATERVAHDDRRTTVKVLDVGGGGHERVGRAGSRTRKIFHDRRFIPRSLHALITSARTTP